VREFEIWARMAHREGDRVALGVWVLHWAQIAIWGISLAGCAWYHAPFGWTALLLFVALASTIGTAVIYYGHQLDVGRTYLEKCSTEIQKLVSELSRDHL